MSIRRDTIAVILLLTPALWSNFHQLLVQWKSFESATAPYDVAQLGSEVQTFKEAGARQERVGYISDAPQDQAAEMLDVMHLQFHFIPTLVVKSTDPAFVVAHIRNPANASSFGLRNGFAVVRTCSDGFILLKRQLPK